MEGEKEGGEMPTFACLHHRAGVRANVDEGKLANGDHALLKELRHKLGILRILAS